MQSEANCRDQMSDNVIKFRKPKPPKASRPWLRKLLIIIVILAVFAVAGLFSIPWCACSVSLQPNAKKPAAGGLRQAFIG
jgi:hypothetical protein